MSVFSGKSALITGASAGLGEEFAMQLADLGVSRFLITARRGDRLEALKAKLLATHSGIKVEIIAADISESNVVTWFLSELEKLNFQPDILINNAGFGDLGTFETSEPARMEMMISLNIAALTRLTHAVLPAMLKNKSGWICNVGSTAGILPLPTFAVYAASKAYVNSFSEALRIELHGSGVHVLALLPGPVETEFGSVASRANSKRKFGAPAFLCVPKEAVVHQTLAAMIHGQARLIPGLLVRFPMLLAESTPRWIVRLVFNLMTGDFRKEREKANPS